MSELLCKFQIVALCLVVMKQTNEAVSKNYESCVVVYKNYAIWNQCRVGYQNLNDMKIDAYSFFLVSFAAGKVIFICNDRNRHSLGNYWEIISFGQ